MDALLQPQAPALALRVAVLRPVQRASRAWRALKVVVLLLAARALLSLHRRQRVPRTWALDKPQKPFLSFTGSGLCMAYYHGIATYLRDHFYVDSLQLSAISGGTSMVLALAMGIDLFQILLVGLHLKKWLLSQGVYLNPMTDMVAKIVEVLSAIGITDQDVSELSARDQCFLGVTQCCPPRHKCIGVPATLQELAQLMAASMCVVPFFSSPGEYRGKYYVDGGFSACWSVPSHAVFADVIKVTCFPRWCTYLPPALSADVDIQPTETMLTEVLVLFPWARQQQLIRRGYEDAKKKHDLLVARGLRPLPNAPLTPWRDWEKLFSEIDENDLPPLGRERMTKARSPLEMHHDQLLRTYSASDLQGVLKGPRLRRLVSESAMSEPCAAPALISP